MQFQLPLQIAPLPQPITYQSRISLFGSCFTENIWNYMHKACFTAHFNSHGIVFNPMSVSKAIQDCVQHKIYTTADLFYLNEIYNSWYHHSDFSDIDATVALEKINHSISFFHTYLQQSDCLIITLGSAFVYQHIEQQIYVSNNHRAPAQWFEKQLLSVEEIVTEMRTTLQQLRAHNQSKSLQIIFTISPVRHIRDGVVDNNRSKARLIEAVHTLCATEADCYYFPAYEMVIDVLRDYRFYDIDMVHPNFAATQYVWEKFSESCLSDETKLFVPQFTALSQAMAHKPFQPRTQAHQQFLETHLQKTLGLAQQFPHLDLQRFVTYFGQ
jgi:hypothetical protein